uniref:Peptidase S1 domain-containing protein n=1 Tax=Pelodiscus sinensis TaxID=13735 RepID=K7F7Y1_PELSI
MLILILLPVVFLLPPGAGAGEIVGGHEAKPHSRPYMAFLEIQRGDTIFHCGGFLVAENFALTAAHCQGDSVTVVLGAHNLSQRERSLQVIRARRQIPHPQYDRETRNNDIMLLQLQRKARRDGYVSLLPLPEDQQRVSPGTGCSIAGWGRTSAAHNLTSNVLLEADVVVMPDADCAVVIFVKYEVVRAAVGPETRSEFFFQGDSGGPLVCGQKAQGIVSWGSTDGIPPAVYARVSTFLPWIQETMRKLQ